MRQRYFYSVAKTALNSIAGELIAALQNRKTRSNAGKTGVAEVNIAKQRDGATGVVSLAFRGEFSRFENLAPRNAAKS